ncbi:MAG TPA: tryptophan synthase subunit alpha [Prolixibacteraceae bacterium]|nr:tryptophan synthase subunit alpha [Prolixibacteraceae bacterium]HPT30869.1 tryptophan synthase subunit alpha [Prolixibacteraceae bacterium]
MNRIDHLFQNKKSRILSVFFTAGFPGLNDTVPIIELLEKNGVDLIEIGIPFSDPTADGPDIQHSNDEALKNGMSLELLFSQLEGIREKVSLPLILMGYFNPVMQFGVERFCRKCRETGIDGVILPDLPPWEYDRQYKTCFEGNGLHNILLITPQTSDERIREADRQTGGFLYMVSSSSTTGAGKEVSDFQTEYFERVRRLNPDHPRLIGFGISNRATFENACQYASGAIIGSAFIRALQEPGTPEEKVGRFVRQILPSV